MNEFYKEYFHVPENGKVREKVMLMRTAVTVAVMVFCMVAVCFSAYAYFSHDVISGANTIKTAVFDAEISVLNEENQLITHSSKGDRKAIYSFSVPGKYTVTLTKGNSSCNTGFCIIHVGSDKYHTQQIGTDVSADGGNRESVSFILQINEPTTVAIQSHWGTSSHYNYDSTSTNVFYIEETDPLKEIVVGVSSAVDEDENQSKGDGTDDTVQSDENEESTSDAPDTTQTPVSSGKVHTVAPGEDLTKIAELYSTTVDRILEYNGIVDPATVTEGQIISIPPVEENNEQNNDSPIDSSEESTENQESEQPDPPESTEESSESAGPVEPSSAEPEDNTEASEPSSEDTAQNLIN